MQPSFSASTAAVAVAASAAGSAAPAQTATHAQLRSIKVSSGSSGLGVVKGIHPEPTQVEAVAVHELCSGQQQLQRGVEGGQCQGQDVNAPLVCQQAKQGDLLHFNNVST